MHGRQRIRHNLLSGIKRMTRGRKPSEEKTMCPVCIASTAAIVAGAGSTGGILAACIGKFRKLFTVHDSGVPQPTKEK
jgi:hypothetical protein